MRPLHSPMPLLPKTCSIARDEAKTKHHGCPTPCCPMYNHGPTWSKLFATHHHPPPLHHHPPIPHHPPSLSPWARRAWRRPGAAGRRPCVRRSVRSRGAAKQRRRDANGEPETEPCVWMRSAFAGFFERSKASFSAARFSGSSESSERRSQYLARAEPKCLVRSGRRCDMLTSARKICPKNQRTLVQLKDVPARKASFPFRAATTLMIHCCINLGSMAPTPTPHFPFEHQSLHKWKPKGGVVGFSNL